MVMRLHADRAKAKPRRDLTSISTVFHHGINLSWIQTVCYNYFKMECLCKQRMLMIHDGGWSWKLARLGVIADPLQIFRIYSILLFSRNVELSRLAKKLLAFHLLAFGRNSILELKCSHARTRLLGSLVCCMYKVLKPATCIVGLVATLYLTALPTFPPNNRSAPAFFPTSTLW